MSRPLPEERSTIADLPCGLHTRPGPQRPIASAGGPMTTITIGLDLGDRLSHVCVLDAEGLVVHPAAGRTAAPAPATLAGRRPGARVGRGVGAPSPWGRRPLPEPCRRGS